MDLGLQGKTAVVTGGASTIGKAIVEGLCAEGVNVVIADMDEVQAERVAAQLCAAGHNASFVATDVGERAQVEHLAQSVLAEHGRVDILVNGAGWTVNGLFLDKPVEDWEREVAVNLWGPINTTRAFAPSMVERGYGKIINIGSDAGRVGEYQEAVYGACKGGVIALSKALARELGRYKVTVNVVCPGLTLPEKTEDAGSMSLWHSDSPQSQIFRNQETLAKVVKRYPLRRHGVPADIVPLVLLLASDQSSYITGQIISVSGGYAM